MAKVDVKSLYNSFNPQKSSFPELKCGLDINEDCSSKYDFDISLLLNGNETLTEKKGADNDYWIDKYSDNNESSCSSQNSLIKPESSKFASLDILAENHLKENKMLSELRFDGNFSLSDLLCNDNSPVLFSSKNISSESDNLFDLCLLTEDGDCTVGRKSDATTNDISFDDLSNWMNSSITQTSDSFELSHHLFSLADTEYKLNKSPVSFHLKSKDTNTEMTDCPNSIQEKSRCADNVSEIDLVNLLSEVSSDSSNTMGSSKINGEEYESTNEISNGDFLPDIDLTFCIKKNSKNNFCYGNSPETSDSGFDESDFTPDKLSIQSEGKLFYTNSLISDSSTDSKFTTDDHGKQNLFSKAISAMPKIDSSRKSKLKNVLNGLLKELPLIHHTQQIKSQKIPVAIDHSNESVIISSYLKF